ncbi:MAG TPA: peptide-methionine (S)-S-oxide reductase MsrA [Gemmataceae bacterium]|jgi:peptide-methionine (S)-S-oxide reductase|nr:peptide-methionine (S)-S-oxide reductase MsrA [Gemmataceae bacterium]
MAKATFAAGRFWYVEETFRTVRGVSGTAVGYMGGTTENPAAEAVAAGDTGHVEVVEIDYDPIKVRYRQLLDVFWRCHDPTQAGRQGRNVGPQFRSVIFYHTYDQKVAAEHSRMMVIASRKHDRPVVTQIAPAERFWPAADDQQPDRCERT